MKTVPRSKRRRLNTASLLQVHPSEEFRLLAAYMITPTAPTSSRTMPTFGQIFVSLLTLLTFRLLYRVIPLAFEHPVMLRTSIYDREVAVRNLLINTSSNRADRGVGRHDSVWVCAERHQPLRGVPRPSRHRAGVFGDDQQGLKHKALLNDFPSSPGTSDPVFREEALLAYVNLCGHAYHAGCFGACCHAAVADTGVGPLGDLDDPSTANAATTINCAAGTPLNHPRAYGLALSALRRGAVAHAPAERVDRRPRRPAELVPGVTAHAVDRRTERTKTLRVTFSSRLLKRRRSAMRSTSPRSAARSDPPLRRRYNCRRDLVTPLRE